MNFTHIDDVILNARFPFVCGIKIKILKIIY